MSILEQVRQSCQCFQSSMIQFKLNLLQILHEFRNGQGAWLTIRAGLVNLGLQNPRCNAEWLISLSSQNIQNLFDLKSQTSLLGLAEQLHTSIREIGNQLLEGGYQTPGQFVMANMTNSAVRAVAALVESFPFTFKDEYVVPGEGEHHLRLVCFYKKAQLVVSEMNLLFGERNPDLFAYSDIDLLTAFVDNVVVAMMRMKGIVGCVEELTTKISEGNYLKKGSEEEVALRSAALNGVEIIVTTLRKMRIDGGEDINSQKLCNWLWGCLGKAGANRKYPRHLCPSTSFY